MVCSMDIVLTVKESFQLIRSSGDGFNMVIPLQNCVLIFSVKHLLNARAYLPDSHICWFSTVSCIETHTLTCNKFCFNRSEEGGWGSCSNLSIRSSKWILWMSCPKGHTDGLWSLPFFHSPHCNLLFRFPQKGEVSPSIRFVLRKFSRFYVILVCCCCFFRWFFSLNF